MQELNSVLIEGRLYQRPGHDRLQDGRLVVELEHGTDRFPVVLRAGRLADLVEDMADGQHVRLVGRLIGWPLITGPVLAVEHAEVKGVYHQRSRETAARAMERADLNGAD